MQEREFIPKIGMNKKAFWAEVTKRAKDHQGDNILIYMGLMLEQARAKHVPVRNTDIMNYGKELPLIQRRDRLVRPNKSVRTICWASSFSPHHFIRSA
jgi:hypothetical protein